MLRSSGEHMDYPTREWFWPQNHWWRVSRFGPQNLGGVPVGTKGGVWHYQEACIDVKQCYEELVDIRSIDLKLIVTPLGLSGLALIT